LIYHVKKISRDAIPSGTPSEIPAPENIGFFGQISEKHIPPSIAMRGRTDRLKASAPRPPDLAKMTNVATNYIVTTTSIEAACATK
jgi:hypothetical protein